MFLVGLSVAVYLLMGIRSEIIAPLLISEYLAPVLPEIFDGQIWRLITPIFLHFGIFHIVFNMLWTWELGRIIEWRQGAPLLGALVLIIGLVSNIFQYWIDGPLFGGMSGVIYGLFGYVWMQSVANPRFGIRLNPAIVKLLLGWFLVCWSGILERLFGLAVANTAHTAGLATGLLLSFMVLGLQRLRGNGP